MDSSFFYSPFAWGLYLGLVFAALALYRYIESRFEVKKLKGHLHNHLDIQATGQQKIKDDLEKFRKENENLRIKVASLNENPDKRSRRDLEVFARAEKRMLVSVPGFAPAWDAAKNAALSEIQDEEAGREQPKSVFSRIFGGANDNVTPAKTLTDSPQPTQPS